MPSTGADYLLVARANLRAFEIAYPECTDNGLYRLSMSQLDKAIKLFYEEENERNRVSTD